MPESFTVKKIDHVNLRTQNLEEIEAFYCGLLGFDRMQQTETSHTRHFGFDNTVMLHVVPSEDATAPAHPQIEHFAFAASNLQDLKTRLTSASVEFREIQRGETTALDFRDPDGNRIHFDFKTKDDG